MQKVEFCRFLSYIKMSTIAKKKEDFFIFCLKFFRQLRLEYAVSLLKIHPV